MMQSVLNTKPLEQKTRRLSELRRHKSAELESRYISTLLPPPLSTFTSSTRLSDAKYLEVACLEQLFHSPYFPKDATIREPSSSTVRVAQSKAGIDIAGLQVSQ